MVIFFYKLYFNDNIFYVTLVITNCDDVGVDKGRCVAAKLLIVVTLSVSAAN
jgi:hypothetical protein